MSNKINNTDYIRLIAKDTGYTQKDVAEVLKSAANVVADQLKTGNSVAVFRGVTFKNIHRAERQGRNPQTGESITIKAHYSPKVEFGTTWKENLA